jgi:hypothetical protein
MKTIIIFILSFVITSSAFAQATAIPDVNFEQKLIALGIDSDGLNGQILNADAAVVTKLDLYVGYNIGTVENLTGIAAFVNLDTLICRHNHRIETVDVTANTLLRYLDCSSINDLISINTTGNSNLTYLNCGYTPITSINITTNTGLEHLICNKTDLPSLNLTANASLKYLDCQDIDVPLTSLDLTSNPALEYVNCRDNRIVNLDCSSNPALEELDCTSNELVTMSVTNCPNLRVLKCAENWDLIIVDVTANPLLEYLDCENLRYGLPSIDVTSNPLLEYLNVDYSGITSLDVTSNPLLQYLSCSDTYISTLDVTTNPQLEYLNCGGRFQNTSPLTILDLTNNPLLVRLFCAANNLTTLDLTNNPLLEVVRCDDNNLVSINVTGNPLLDFLSCDNNNLTNLDVSGNPLLRRFYCEGNNITVLDLTSNVSLDWVYCRYNSMTSLSLGNHPLLRLFVCEENNLTNLDVSGCSILERFEGENNDFVSLDFSTNSNLVILKCNYNNLSTLYLPINGQLLELFCYENRLERLDVTGNPNLDFIYCKKNLPYLRICKLSSQIPDYYWTKDASAVYSEDCYPFAVKGKVVVDNNLNCVVDTTERGLSGQWLKFEKTTDTTVFYFTTYDTLGNYRAYLDTGVYTVTVLPSSSYWAGCPTSQSVTIDTNYVVQTLDWSLQEVISCPLLEVDIAAPYLRSTGGGSAYTVSYCNNGTTTAQGAYAVVDLDPDLNFISSTTPVLSQSGSEYTFFIGNVGVGFCGSFQIQVTVDSNAQFEQTHCTDVHIYPDSICLPLWAGPIVDGAANCQNDTVQFDLNNIGTLMPQTQNYTVIQDDIAMRTGVIQLGAGQSTTIMEPALPGSTYRIEVDQSSGYPIFLGDPIFSSAIEGCNPLANGTFNTGFITQFSNGYSSPFRAIDCQPNVGSYDPNDKSAQPVGYGSQHYIDQNIAIDYKVRFQNTGTDTAFNIVIIDTLSNYFNVFSLEMGASSHNYNWTVENGNVIKVSFPNIMLVDSNANEALSHGFFRYRISQKLNNPLGSLIENQAAIYFDYNPPIFTNTTFHTIGENFVPLILTIEDLYEEHINVTAFPNPFDYSTTIKVEGKEYNELELSVFDVSGRVMTEKKISSSNQIQLSKGNLQTGIYFYKLKGDGKLLNTGKLLVQ